MKKAKNGAKTTPRSGPDPSPVSPCMWKRSALPDTRRSDVHQMSSTWAPNVDAEEEHEEVKRKMNCRRNRSGCWPSLLSFALVCIVSACSAAPIFAYPHTNNAGATRAYLRARGIFERSLRVKLGASLNAIEGRATQIAKECPSALTYAPRDMAFGELGKEASLTVALAGVAPVRSTFHVLAQSVGRLHWTNRKLTRLVRALMREERAAAHIVLPDVCADIAAWKASAYVVLPSSTSRFLAEVSAIEASPSGGPPEESVEAAIRSLLRHYENPAERLIAKRVERLEATFSKRMNAAYTAATARLASALGVSAL